MSIFSRHFSPSGWYEGRAMDGHFPGGHDVGRAPRGPNPGQYRSGRIQ